MKCLEEFIEQATHFNNCKNEIIQKLNNTVLANDKQFADARGKVYGKIIDLTLTADFWVEITLLLSNGEMKTIRETNLRYAILNGWEELDNYIEKRMNQNGFQTAHNYKEDECGAVICGYLWNLSALNAA